MPGKIALRAYVTKAAHYKLARDIARLRRAVLEEEPGAAREVCGRLANDAAQISESVHSRRQGDARLEGEGRLQQQAVILSDVGRIGDDEIENTSAEGLDPRAVQEFELRCAKGHRIGARKRKRSLTDVGCRDLPARPLVGERER